MNISYKDLIDLCHTKAIYYQNKASELNDANYLSDSKFCLVMADYLLKASQEVTELSKDTEPVLWTTTSLIGTSTMQDENYPIPLFTRQPNAADIEQRVAEACAKACESVRLSKRGFEMTTPTREHKIHE